MSPRGSLGLGSTAKRSGVAPLDDVPRENVEGLLVAIEGGPDILRGTGLGALAPSPEDNDSRPELGGEIEVVEHLTEREATHLTVVGREGAVAEDRVREEVGGHHGDHQTGGLHRLAQPTDRMTLLGGRGVEREDVVVVEAHPIGAQLGQPVDGHHRVQRRAHRRAEDVDTLPTDRPEPERKAVFAARLKH